MSTAVGVIDRNGHCATCAPCLASHEGHCPRHEAHVWTCSTAAIVVCKSADDHDGPHTFDCAAVMSETMPRNLAVPFVPTHPAESRATQAAAELAAEDRAARDDCRPDDYPPYPTTAERADAARRAATPSPDTCANDDHEPDPDGTHCLRCGIIAEPVGPAELAEHLTAGYADAVEAIRDRAQLARIGGRALLRYYSVTTRPYRPWTIALHPSHDNALDTVDAEYARRIRAQRDANHDIVRPHWPIMRAAVESAGITTAELAAVTTASYPAASRNPETWR